MTSERTRDLVDEISTRLIRRAAGRAPDSLAARLEEEWLADLGAQRGSVARLRFAAGCWWAMGIIVREHPIGTVAATATASNGIVGYPQTSSQFFNTRTMSLVLVAALHLAVLYGLMMARAPAGPAKTELFTAKVITSPALPNHVAVSVAQLWDMRLKVPQPTEIPLAPADPADGIEGQVTEARQIVEVPPTPPAPVHRVTGGPGIGFPSTDEFYPDSAIRMGEKGAATVQVCVDGKGWLTGEPALVASTGSSRLDAGALRLAKAGSGHYRATTEEGRPVSSCYSFLVRFQLKN